MATTDTPAPQGTALTGDAAATPAEASAGGTATPPSVPPASSAAPATPGETPPAPPPPPDAKPAEASKAAEAKPPVDIELKLPEGITADDAVIAKLKPLAKELGLDSPKAQKLADFYAAVRSETAKADETQLAASLDKQQAGWREAAKTDKEIGGGDFARNLQLAKKAMTQFGTPELTQYLHKTGLGDHPELVRLMVKVGKALSEDALVHAGSGIAAAAQSEQARLRGMYPNSPDLFKGPV